MASNNLIITASAPATLMLMGEHAVLYGQPAIACAVEQRIVVTLKTNDARRLVIESALGQYDQPLDKLDDHPLLRFVIEAVRAQLPSLSQGITLSIESEFSHKVGLGSSSAVTVAVTAALYQLINHGLDLRQVFLQARNTMLTVQGRGSGADLAASTYGALIAYRMEPVDIQPLGVTPDIALYYSGYKTPTPEVVARVAEQRQQIPGLYDDLYQLMGKVTGQAINAASQQNWPLLGRLMNYYQGLLDSLGVNDQTLSEIIYRLREQQVYGAKISGSGLGDCVVSLGQPIGSQTGQLPYQRLPVNVAPEGVIVVVKE